MWPIVQSICESLPWIIVAIWAIQLSLVIVGVRYRQLITDSQIEVAAHLPALTVLLAARNEENCIETCVRSLIRQDYPSLEIIAINDRSTDATPIILDRLQGEFCGKLTVIHVNSLPAGWFGKAHALHTGMQLAKGEWLCFTDADCEQISERTLSLAMTAALERRVDMLTLIPRFLMKSVWEYVTMPVCSWLMMIWFQPKYVNNPKSGMSYANGSFMMMSRRCYDATGGWSQVRAQLCEDAALARLIKSMGLKMVMVQNDGLYRTRMYETVRDAWNGWSRIYYGTLSQQKLVVSIIRLLLCSVIPSWLFVLTLIRSLLSGSDITMLSSTTFIGWSTVVILQQAQAAIAYRMVGVPTLWSLTAPLGHLFMLSVLIRASLNHFGIGTLSWRGSSFRQGRILALSLPPFNSQPRPVKSPTMKALSRKLAYRQSETVLELKANSPDISRPMPFE